MIDIFDRIRGLYSIEDILHRMEKNCPEPSSTSRELWKLRHKTDISSHNSAPETMLEKSISMLAKNGHMPEWFNQCPTASGIGDSSKNKHSNVDLVRWNEVDESAYLIELKWESNTPSEAIQQVLRYGAAYLYCRKHRDKLPVKDRPILDARQITLCVLAPARFYHYDSDLENFFKKAQKGLRKLNARPPIAGMSISIEVLALPESFSALPFANGAEVKESCNRVDLTYTGRQIRDAFNGLVPVCA